MTTPVDRSGDQRIATRVIRAIEGAPAGLLALLKRPAGIVILLVVAGQLVLPLHYYTVRKDPHDERFAWRMFSPMRMARCSPRFTLDNQPITLGTEFHEAWIEIAKRGRFGVIEQMGARLCAKHPNSAVHVVVTCRYQGRPDQTFGGYDLCKVPLL